MQREPKPKPKTCDKSRRKESCGARCLRQCPGAMPWQGKGYKWHARPPDETWRQTFPEHGTVLSQVPSRHEYSRCTTGRIPVQRCGFLLAQASTGQLPEAKSLCTEAPVLARFDPSKEATIQCDAGSYGLGGVLLQEDRPMAFTSRALTQTEQRYAQIEKEALATLARYSISTCLDIT